MADQGEVDNQLCKAGVFVLRVAEFRTIRNSEVLLASVKGPGSSVGGTPLRWHSLSRDHRMVSVVEGAIFLVFRGRPEMV